MSEIVKVRSFNRAGIAAVRQLLGNIRADNDLHSDDAKALLSNPILTEEVKNAPEIDLDRQFAAKMDMIGYFTPIFDEAFMATFLVKLNATSVVASTRSQAGGCDRWH